MKSSAFCTTLTLLLGFSTAALAQTTTPASNAPIDNNSNVLTPNNDRQKVRTAVDGSNIANNRDVLAPGTGTNVQPVRSPAEKRAHREAKRARKGKMKSTN